MEEPGASANQGLPFFAIGIFEPCGDLAGAFQFTFIHIRSLLSVTVSVGLGADVDMKDWIRRKLPDPVSHATSTPGGGAQSKKTTT